MASRRQLSQFFTEWFDTAYPSSTATEPDITAWPEGARLLRRARR
jgi:hypothetical protein